MGVLMGALTPRDTFIDTEGTLLGGAYDVAAVTLGGLTYVYVTSPEENGITVFTLGSSGDLSPVGTVPSSSMVGLDGAGALTVATVGSTTYLYATAILADSVSAFRVEADGSLTFVQTVTDTTATYFGGPQGRPTVATFGSTSYLAVPGATDSGFSLFEILADGTLVNRNNVPDARTIYFQMSGTFDTATAVVDGRSFIFATGYSDDGLTVFQVLAGHGLMDVDSRGDTTDLELDGANGIVAATVGIYTYVVVSGALDDGLTVYRVNGEGHLREASTLTDTTGLSLDGAAGMSTMTIGGETFVALSSETEEAVSLFHLSEAGTLTLIDAQAGLAEALDGTLYNRMTLVDGVPFLLAAGRSDGGLTAFEIGGGRDVLVGTGEDDLLLGLGGDDELTGGDGVDRILGGDGSDVLSGDAGNDTMVGGAGQDELRALSGTDFLFGGLGDDTYLLGGSSFVTEAAGQGYDTVRSSVSHVLDANMERLILVGAGDLDGFGNDGDNSITGTAGVNYLSGHGGADTLDGLAGADEMYGRADDDSLFGGDGNDVLDGGTGTDRLVGGGGDDTYILAEAGDVIVEAEGGGIDRVDSAVSVTLGGNVENLFLTHFATINGRGNALGNRMTGNRAANLLSGGAGNDSLYGDWGNDVLDGGTEIDLLVGGMGDDTYVLATAGDTISELAWEGTDRINSAVSLTLSAYVENLLLTGTANVNGTGNGEANRLVGNGGANSLSGLGGVDTLLGGGGHDTLDGGAETDRLEGGGGNDTYVLAASGDTIVELAGAGADLVKAAVTHTLALEVENLLLTGAANLNGTGNGSANRLTGNGGANLLSGLGGVDVLLGGGGADRLTGGAGLDSLSGGLGNDVFVFASRAEAGDVITDFRNVLGDNDSFALTAAAFGTGLAARVALTTTQFQTLTTTAAVTDTTAATSLVRFIWEADDERLWSDTNGNGAGGLALLADLQEGATLGRNDLVMV